MTEQKLMPLEELINQWDEEMPLMTVEMLLRQVLGHVEEGKAERAKFMRRIDDLTIAMADLRSQLKQKGDVGNVNL